MKSLLTIVIPTKNRNKYLKRTINYWLDTDYTIVVADGSNKPDKDLKKNKKILYFHSKKNIHERMNKAIDFVKTKYVLSSSDDEFFSKEKVLKYINFLNKNTKYIACGGAALSFDYFNSSFFYKLSYLKKLKKINIENFSKYSVNYYYSINRSNFWKKNIKKSLKIDKKYKVFAIGEIVFEYLMMLDGKIFKFNDIFWFRSLENPPQIQPKTKFSIWWENMELTNKIFFLREFLKQKKIVNQTIKTFDDLSFYLKNKKTEKPSLFRRVIFRFFNITYVKMYNKNKIIKNIKKNRIRLNLQEIEVIQNCIRET